MYQYETFEIKFQATEPGEDQVHVDLYGEFTLGGKTKKVPAFYAGDGIYKIRFLPEETGLCSWKVSGIVEANGSEECLPAREGQHGMVHAEGTHFVYADGSLFHSFGTTIYGLVHQSDDVIADTMETLKNGPFNKVRLCVFPKHYHYNHNEPRFYPFAMVAGHCYDPGKAVATTDNGLLTDAKWDTAKPVFAFWDFLEEKLDEIASYGIQVDLILFHPYDRWGFSHMTPEEDATYLDYLLRRLSAKPYIWWSLANEYDIFRAKGMEDWYRIEEIVATLDPYGHLLSNHNCFAHYDFARKNVTHVSLQNRAVDRVGYFQKLYHKPVCYDECCYEGNLEETFGSLTGQDMSDRFWKVSSCGGYCTHGETYIDYDDPDIEDAVVFWAKGGKLKGSSPKRIAYLREIIESLPGPLEALDLGLNTILAKRPEELQAMVDAIPSSMRPFFAAIASMSERELAYHLVPEATYGGHVGEEAYLFYYGLDVHGRITLDLPEQESYTVEAIDTWNMTRKVVARGVHGHMAVRTPEIQYMALLARKE